MIFLQTYRKNKNHDLLQTYTYIYAYGQVKTLAQELEIITTNISESRTEVNNRKYTIAICIFIFTI